MGKQRSTLTYFLLVLIIFSANVYSENPEIDGEEQKASRLQQTAKLLESYAGILSEPTPRKAIAIYESLLRNSELLPFVADRCRVKFELAGLNIRVKNDDEALTLYEEILYHRSRITQELYESTLNRMIDLLVHSPSVADLRRASILAKNALKNPSLSASTKSKAQSTLRFLGSTQREKKRVRSRE